MTSEEDAVRYNKAIHAVQTGVKLLLESDPKMKDPKHLRVGIDSALVGNEALATLLIQKGVFTLEEYVEANADAMEREVARHEERLNAKGGPRVTLG